MANFGQYSSHIQAAIHKAKSTGLNASNSFAYLTQGGIESSDYHDLVDRFNYPTTEELWGHYSEQAVAQHESAHVIGIIESGQHLREYQLVSGPQGLGGYTLASDVSPTLAGHINKLVLGAAGEYAGTGRVAQMERGWLGDAFETASALHPELMANRSLFGTQHINEYMDLVRARQRELESSPQTLDILSQMREEMLANPVASSESYVSSGMVSAMGQYANLIGGGDYQAKIEKQYEADIRPLWSLPGGTNNLPLNMGMQSMGGITFPQDPYMMGSYPSQGFNGVMGYDQIFAGARNRPDYITMSQGNAIYDAQQHLYGGMSAERRAQMPRQGEDPKINEAAQELNKTFKELAETMGISAKQGVTYRQVLQTVFDAAGLNPNNPQSVANISAYKAIQGMGAAGIDVGQALANWDMPRAGGIGGSGIQPPSNINAQMAMPVGQFRNQQVAVPIPGYEPQEGQGLDASKLFAKAARSYYAIRGPYREFIEPAMQDIQAYGQYASAQFGQLASYGLGESAFGGTYSQYARLISNQQFAQIGSGRAAMMAYGGIMGGNAGQNENLNFLTGVLGPAAGAGLGLGMVAGPVAGTLAGLGMAAYGTAQYGASALQDPLLGGRFMNAIQSGGLGGGLANNLPASIMSGIQRMGARGIGGTLNDWSTALTYGLNSAASSLFGTPAPSMPNMPQTAQDIQLDRFGNIVSGFQNQSMGQVLGGGVYGPPAATMSGLQIGVGAQMLATNNDITNMTALNAASRSNIATQIVSAYGLQGAAGQGMMNRQNIIASNMAAAQLAGVDVNKFMGLYTAGLGGNQFSTIGTGAYGQALDVSSAWAASNPLAAGVMQQYAGQISSGQTAAINQGIAPMDMSVWQQMSAGVATGGIEQQRLMSRMALRQQMAPGLTAQLRYAGYSTGSATFADTAYNMLGDNGLGDLGMQGAAAQALLQYGIAGRGAIVAGGQLGERGFNIQQIMSNRLLGMGMNAASAGALGTASTALTQFNDMNNAQAQVRMQAEAQAAQINLGYGAYGNMSSGNFNLLTRGFMQAPGQAAQFGALVSGNAIAWSQAADQGIGPQAWRTVQTGSQGGTAGMGAGYDERISAAQAGMVSARGIASGFIRGDGRYSIAQISGMNERQRTEALYGLQIESRNEGFAYETANLERSRRSQLTERGFEDTGIALSRAQQDWGRYIQGQQIGIQGQQIAYNYQYGAQQLQIQRSHEITQQGWQQQDLAYQRNVNELQYGFNMIDAQENIRYSTGRERRVAMRHRDEQTVLFSMQEGQQTREEQRAATQRQWSEQQFNLNKSHFEQEHQFELQNFELTKQNYQKEGEFIREQRVLEDQERTFRRAIQDEQFAADKQHLLTTQSIKKTMDDLNGATQTWNTLVAEAKANMQYQASTGTILNQQAVQYYSTQALNTTQAYLTSQSYQQSITYTQAGVGLPGTPTKHIGGAGADLGGIIGMPSYDMGGFTGLGRKNLETGTVHAGEHVVPQGGSLVYSNPDMVRLLSAIHSTLQSIHKDGGNAMINIIQGSPSKVMGQGQSLYQKAYSQ